MLYFIYMYVVISFPLQISYYWPPRTQWDCILYNFESLSWLTVRTVSMAYFACCRRLLLNSFLSLHKLILLSPPCSASCSSCPKFTKLNRKREKAGVFLCSLIVLIIKLLTHCIYKNAFNFFLSNSLSFSSFFPITLFASFSFAWSLCLSLDPYIMFYLQWLPYENKGKFALKC